MSEEKKISDSASGGTPVEPALTDLISSAMKKVEQNKKSAAQTTVSRGAENKAASTDKPDISFAKKEQPQDLPKAAEEKPKAAAPSAPEKAAESADSAPKVQDKPDKVQASTAATSAKQAKPEAAKAAENADKKSAESEKSAEASREAKKPLDPEKSAKAAAIASALESRSDDVEAAAPAEGENGEKVPFWKKFTKKQLATVGGVIGSMLLVLILVIYLIFSYYYGKLGKADSVYNTSAMTYSDTDLSAADTIDKEAEEAKLKELLAMGEKISDKDVMNILLIAEDLRDDSDENAAGNTDVMMIISINTQDKTITMTSVMRDCYVYIPNWYSTRINAAYWHGGVELTQETIESYMNVQIDRYVLVNFSSFIDIVDAVGGIDMYVSDDEANGYEGADPNGDNTRGMQNPLDEQNDLLGNPAGTDYISEGGNLHLNGNQALAYARLRHVGNADYERTERQRKVIAEMIKQSRNMTLVELDKLLNKVLPEIKTDITKTEAAQLLVDMLDYRNYEIQEMRVPADGTFTNERIDGNDVLVVDFEQNAELFRELVYGSIEIDENGVEEDMKIE